MSLMPTTEKTANKSRSIYERLGGEPAIAAAVEQLYERLLTDDLLKGFFTKANLKWLRTRQTQFLSQALGGPAAYRGQGMRDAHAHLKIAQRHFDAVARHLVDALAALQVPQTLIGEVVAVAAPLASEIVNT
jgi:hemoglobin